MAPTSILSAERRREILGTIVLSLTVLLFIALVTDRGQGSLERSLDDMGGVPNLLGKPGAAVVWFLTLLLGHGSHVLYCIMFVWGVMLLRHSPLDRFLTRLGGLFLVICSVTALLHVDMGAGGNGVGAGGALGAFFGGLTAAYFGVVGANVIGITLAIVGVLLATDFLFIRAINAARLTLLLMIEVVAQGIEYLKGSYAGRRERRPRASERASAAAAPAARKTRPAPVAEEEEEEEEEESSPAAERKIRILTRPEPEEEPPFDEVPVVDDAADENEEEESSEDLTAEAPESEPENTAAPGPVQQTFALDEVTPPPAPRPAGRKPPLARRKDPLDIELPDDYVYPKRYKRPAIDIFDPAPPKTAGDLEEHLYNVSVVLEETLRTFGIESRVTDITRGPTITRYELEPAPGIKVSRFTSLADDLALALKAHRVRVEAPIPGKGRVGIEVPNRDREMVVQRELLESAAFRRGNHTLPLPLGKGIGGEVVMADLATMPHLLVAGATGAGKTVCVKTMLASLLYTKTPEEMQLMLIDPKMVELSIFNDIPHLITPVVTDPKKASSALNWLISEMEERYRLFAHLRTRNIEVYNQSVDNGEIEMTESDGEQTESVDAIRKLPYIVCMIDELADLMMLARAEVEDSIARLAQLARAVGIHLIIATQRPSVDVLTGVIKANFPARLSFQVSSRVDSRCILDEIGAERLIGRGDMLYLPAGHSKPIRIQGAFVSDEEMQRLIAYLKTQAPPQYRDEIERFGKSKDGLEDLLDEDDDLFDEAVRVVMETGQASISMVQRRLRVGYTRAARLIDMMELRGIVGPHIGSKAREILIQRPPNNEVA